MKKAEVIAIILGLGVSLLACEAFCNTRAIDPDGVGVAVSPQTLILGQDQGGSITVHTDIAYSLVAAGTVMLDGVAASATFADNLGHLVAKFPEEAIKALVAPPSATLTLEGVTKLGEEFSGDDTVSVINAPKPATAPKAK